MKMLQLEPFYSPKVWGYEQWQFSTHPNGMTTVVESQKPLQHYFAQPLPILIKYIVANETLSVQVHPDDTYAQQHTTDRGKSECWYITEATPGAQLICGLIPGCDQLQLEQAIAEDALEQQLAYIDVAAGDMIYIPAGTVHAIMGGLKLIEIQQSSDTTYRLYDWGRDREIHLQQSFAVIDYENKNGAMKIPAAEFSQLDTPHFRVEKHSIRGTQTLTSSQEMTISIVSGTLTCTQSGQTLAMTANQTNYIAANSQVAVNGHAEILITTW